MKHHVAVKFIAIVLAALALLGALSSAAGILVLMGFDLYNESVDELYEQQTTSERRAFAVNLAHRYASLNLGHCPEEYLYAYYGSDWLYDTFRQGYFFYTIKDETGALVESTLEGDLTNATRYTIHVTDIRYRVVVDEEQITVEEMKQYVRDHMARHKVPRYISFVDSFPMNAAGKILKYKMREDASEMLKLQKAASIETA